MIVRFRGPDGAYRIEAAPEESFLVVLERLVTKIPPHADLAISMAPNAPGERPSQAMARSLGDLGIKHGDMFFVSYNKPSMAATEPNEVKEAPKNEVQVSEVDRRLEGEDGRIPRGHSSLCRHGEKGMCEYCQPLDPWDDEYQFQKGIKHLSYFAYVKKLQHEDPKNIHPLEEPNYSVKKCTSGHDPWPHGICSKCQVPAISLQLQRFRMVDHVEFANPSIISDFIDFWRSTTSQRIGFLIGKYEPYEQIPLGIKANVQYVWECDQSDDTDNLLMKQLPTKGVHKAAAALGLQVVGIIFTDLTDAGDGRVVTKRHAKSYFLSSLEVALAAKLQNEYPNPSLHSESGHFSSKFVMCVVSGNDLGEVDVACYQTSVQAQSLVRADLIVPSTNPSVMRIKQQEGARYVPEMFYRHKNEYGIAVQESAMPAFPVDYLVVSLSHGFKDLPVPRSKFPIENREALRGQTMSQISEVLGLSAGLDSANLADFHVLLFLLNSGTLQPDEEDAVCHLVNLEKENRYNEALDLATQLANGPGLSTIRMIAQS